MNFTKEYIDLCKNDKLQGLRKELQHGDWVFFGKPLLFLDDGVIQVTSPIAKFEDKKIIWLPTSDQLDEIILNICKEKFDGYFQYEMCFITTEWYGTIRYWQKSKEYMKDDELMRYAIKIEENPLICKLKLLISLLKEE